MATHFPEEHLTYKIIGILYEVHNKLGNLLQEKYYPRGISQTLSREKIDFEQEKPVDIKLDNTKIGQYKLDFVIQNKIVLETKTTNISLNIYHHQILSYMNQLQIRIGLLANFRNPKLQLKRLILPDKYLTSI